MSKRISHHIQNMAANKISSTWTLHSYFFIFILFCIGNKRGIVIKIESQLKQQENRIKCVSFPLKGKVIKKNNVCYLP